MMSDRPASETGDGFRLKGMIFLSLLIHVAVLSLLYLSPSFPSPKLTFGPVHTVSLVSLPRNVPGGRSASAMEKEIMADDRPETVLKRRLEPAAAQPIPIRSLEPERKRDSDVEKAVESIKKRAAAMESSVNKSRAKPSRDVDASDAVKRLQTKTPAGGATASDSQPGGTDDQMQAYYALIWSRIKGRWALPQAFLPGEVLEAVIDVTILRGGAVTDVNFEKRSGNRYFDESAMKSIRKASPFPPLPAWIGDKSVEVGIRFHSSELGQ
jgi:colicin import membrane protein